MFVDIDAVSVPSLLMLFALAVNTVGVDVNDKAADSFLIPVLIDFVAVDVTVVVILIISPTLNGVDPLMPFTDLIPTANVDVV